jgi:1-aminocyclopropane-1-carboxylate deaminase
MCLSTENIRIDSLKNLYQPFGVNADVLRLDEVHPVVSGNKWFKLKEYLKEAQRLQKKVIITFGGPYSNHIVATAAACQLTGLQSIGIIRGEEGLTPSPTLADAKAAGMQLYFVSRSMYTAQILPEEVYATVAVSDTYIIKEGGYGLLGSKGAGTILSGIPEGRYSHIVASVGTGTTLAGIIAAAPKSKVTGISALKNNHSLNSSIAALLPADLAGLFEILHDFHFGGYAKRTPSLLQFINDWYQLTGIPSDFVYTGKLFYATDNLIRTGYFARGSSLLLIHSGGLQGNRSLPAGTLIF